MGNCGQKALPKDIISELQNRPIPASHDTTEVVTAGSMPGPVSNSKAGKVLATPIGSGTSAGEILFLEDKKSGEPIKDAVPEPERDMKFRELVSDEKEPESSRSDMSATYTNPETDADWVWNHLRNPSGFLNLSKGPRHKFTNEAFLGLLDWKITGYSIGRKIQDQDASFKEFKEYLETDKLSDDSKTMRDIDNRTHLNIHQTWWIYVRVQHPASEEVKYIKLYLVVPGYAHRTVHPYNNQQHRQSQVKRKYFGKDQTNRRSKLFDKYVGLSSFLLTNIEITVYNSFNYEDSKPDGCRIIEVPQATENSPHRTVFSILAAGTFRGDKKRRPTYLNPEYLGDNRFPVINCITYVMRVIQTLGVEKNPAGWSYLNKKRGRVFKVSELNSLEDDSYVMLDDLPGIYQIQQTEDGALSAVLQDGEGEEKINLTVFQYQGESYIKEVFKLSDAHGRSLKNDYGPRKLGIQRLTCWGDLHSKHLYSHFGVRRNLWEPVSARNEPWSIFGRIQHETGKYKGRFWTKTSQLDLSFKIHGEKVHQRLKREKKLLQALLKRRLLSASA